MSTAKGKTMKYQRQYGQGHTSQEEFLRDHVICLQEQIAKLRSGEEFAKISAELERHKADSTRVFSNGRAAAEYDRRLEEDRQFLRGFCQMIENKDMPAQLTLHGRYSVLPKDGSPEKHVEQSISVHYLRGVAAAISNLHTFENGN